MRVVVRVTVVVRRTDPTMRLARGEACAEAAALRACLAAVVLEVTVADLATEAQTSAPPTAQDSAQRDSCLNLCDTEELEARCITICFSLKQRKNPCKIKNLRGFPQPDVERAGQLVTELRRIDNR